MLQSSTLKFLKELKKNNNKPWFEAHRGQYESARMDFENFITIILDKHSKKDADLRELSAKKCMFRMNRDIRFSKDKTPYKTNFAASMDRGGKKSGFAGYYIHCQPGNSFIGGGIWMPDKDHVNKIRQEIDYCLAEFEKIVTSKKFKTIYPELYSGDGIKLSKIPHGFEKDNPAAEYLKFKSWLVLTNLKDAELTSKDLVKKTLSALEILHPFLNFINRALTTD